MSVKWITAISIFGVAMILLDTHYIMPNYLPVNSTGSMLGSSIWREEGALPVQYIVCLLRFIFGIPIILSQAADSNIAFGAGGWGTAAASALVYYMLLVPYLAVLAFLIEGKDGVPPAYRFFSFFITRSGARHIDKSLGDRGGTFDVNAFDRETSQPRRDKYQARMETEQLKKATERARADAAQTRDAVGRYSAEEEARTRAKVAAADAAEEAFRMKARKRAWERRRKDR